MQEMVFQKTGINFNDLPTQRKRGTAIYKDEQFTIDIADNGLAKIQQQLLGWKIDANLPKFTENRAYIERFVYPLTVVKVGEK